MAGSSASAIKPLADAFLRMIKMIIAPLLFSTLVVGIAGTGDLKTMGRIGLKAIIYFEVATTIALFLGLALVNIFKPGAGLSMPIGADTAGGGRDGRRTSSTPGTSSCTCSRPRSSTRWRAATSCRSSSSRRSSASRVAAIGAKGQPVLDVLESTAQAMFKFTGYVMAFAPIGVFAAIAATVGGKGLGDSVHARQAGRADVSRPRDLRADRASAASRYLIRVPFLTFVQGDPRAVPDRVHAPPAPRRRCRRRSR